MSTVLGLNDNSLRRTEVLGEIFSKCDGFRHKSHLCNCGTAASFLPRVEATDRMMYDTFLIYFSFSISRETYFTFAVF